MPKNVFCKIISNLKIAENIYSMNLVGNFENIKILPGQFIHIKCINLLRRPISICNVISENCINIVFEIRGEGTRWLAERKVEDSLDIIIPLGNGFNLNMSGKNPLFIGGGIGVPPLLFCTKQINGNAILGFNNIKKVILENEFNNYTKNKVIVMTNDGSYGIKGLVTDTLEKSIKNYTSIYACGPKLMLKEIAKLAFKNNIFCQISLEEHMGCGIGACLVCACKVKTNNSYIYKHVCRDGPVFDAKEIFEF